MVYPLSGITQTHCPIWSQVLSHVSAADPFNFPLGLMIRFPGPRSPLSERLHWWIRFRVRSGTDQSGVRSREDTVSWQPLLRGWPNSSSRSTVRYLAHVLTVDAIWYIHLFAFPIVHWLPIHGSPVRSCLIIQLICRLQLSGFLLANWASEIGWIGRTRYKLYPRWSWSSLAVARVLILRSSYLSSDCLSSADLFQLHLLDLECVIRLPAEAFHVSFLNLNIEYDIYSAVIGGGGLYFFGNWLRFV